MKTPYQKTAIIVCIRQMSIFAFHDFVLVASICNLIACVRASPDDKYLFIEYVTRFLFPLEVWIKYPTDF